MNRWITPIPVLAALFVLCACEPVDTSLAEFDELREQAELERSLADNRFEPRYGGALVAVNPQMEFFLEVVRQPEEEMLEIYLFDSENELPAFSDQMEITLFAHVRGRDEVLELKADPRSPAGSGNRHYMGVAPWVADAGQFAGTIENLRIGGKSFRYIVFKFPQGNVGL